jgi:microcystin-dependent protein
MDDKIFARLLIRGHTALKPDKPAEWWAAGKALRRHMIGRLYTKDSAGTEVVVGAGAGGPPSGAAGGDLTGSSYPNPVIANGAVTTAKIADGTIDTVDLSSSVLALMPPTGAVIMFGGTGGASPFGWMWCDGSAISQTTYAALYAVLGLNFTPSGTTAGLFCVPDMRGRFPLGVNPGVSDATYGTPGRNENNAGTAAGGDTQEGRLGRLNHRHTHAAGGLSNSSQDLGQQTNTTATAGANRLSGPASHSHTITGSTGSGGVGTNPTDNLANHGLLTLNFIIKT